MSAKELPSRPNFNQYRKQAKDLLKSFRAGDGDALSRISEVHPEFKKTFDTPFQLSDAQWVIAREHGFESWPKFADHIRQIVAENASRASTTESSRALFAIDLDIKTDELNTCVFTRDGKRALIGAGGNLAGVWDVETGRRVISCGERSVGAWAVAWSRDERHAFVGTLNGAVQVWDVEAGVCLRVIKVHNSFVRCIDLSSDSRRVISGSGGMRPSTIKFWEVETERTISVMEGHSDGVYAVALDPTERHALSGSRDGTVRLWDLETAACLRVFKGHSNCVLWSKDRRRMLSGARDIRLWDIESGQCIRVFEQTEGDTLVRQLAWSADQRRVLSAQHNNTVRLWDVETGSCLRIFQGHPVGVVTVMWSADERRAYSCDWIGGVRVWDVSNV